MLSRVKSTNIGFSQVVQLFALDPQTQPPLLAQKIPFINSEKKIFWMSTMCAQILGFSRVRVSIRVSLVQMVCGSTLDNNVAPSVE